MLYGIFAWETLNIPSEPASCGIKSASTTSVDTFPASFTYVFQLVMQRQNPSTEDWIEVIS